jgi:hypothetical protein
MATKKRSPAQAPSGIRVKPGTHTSLIHGDPSQLTAALDFLAEGIRQGEVCAVLAYARFNERIAAQLRDLHGIDMRRALLEGAVGFVSGAETIKPMRAELTKFFGRAVKTKRPKRLLTSFGWGEADWPDEDELLQLECWLGEYCAQHAIAAVCLYDERQLGGSVLFRAGLECHATVLVRGTLHKNPFFVSPDVIQKEVGARRRDEERLNAWIS